MAEKHYIYDKIRTEYEGIFSTRELLDTIIALSGDKGYLPFEPKHSESIKEEGKFIDITISLQKKFTDYAKSILMIYIQASGVKDKIITIGDKKKNMQEGKLVIIFDAVLETDYERRWESKPMFWFMRKIFELYVYSPLIKNFNNTVKSDADFFIGNIKSYLNLIKL